ncbi:MAG TPA: hypothetical protein ENN64_01305 [bacterium]|nr:hypothetical protein [bacterium]
MLFLESRGGIKVDNLIFKKYLFIDEQNIFEIEISRLISSEEDVNELRSIYDTRFLLSTDYDKNYFYYSYIGTYLNQAKRYRDSVKFLEDAYDLQKNYTEREDIYRMRILSLYLEGLLSKEVSNTDLAKEVIEYGLEKNPNYPLLHYYKAKLLLLDGDKDGAKLALESFYENSSSVYINQDLPEPSEDKNLKVLLD